MVRSDALNTLKHQAGIRGFFASGPSAASGAEGAVSYGVAHGRLDILGALEAEGGGTLAQMVLPGQVAVGYEARPEAAVRVRSLQVVPPVGDPEVAVPTGDWAGWTHTQAAAHFAEMSTGRAGWAAGPLALAWHMQNALNGTAAGLPGANILIHGELPMGAGQASSTATLVALARSIAAARAVTPEPIAMARWVALAEAFARPGHAGEVAPSRGHVVDALTSLHGRPGHAALLRYSAQPHRFVGTVPLPAEVRVFALDTGVRHRSTRSTLEELRVAAAMGLRIIDTIYRDLGQPHTPLHGYLTNTSPLLYRQYFRALLPKRLRGADFVRTYGALSTGEGDELWRIRPGELDGTRLYRVRTAVDHLIAESEHAEQFVQAMEELAEAGDGAAQMDTADRERTLQRAGRLLLASHHSYRLRLELSCREADWLVDCLMESGPDRGVYGARITGCGGGGTVVALLNRSSAATDVLLGGIKSYHQLTGLTLGVTDA